MSLLARNIDVPIIQRISEERRGQWMSGRQAAVSVTPSRDAKDGTGAVLESGGRRGGHRNQGFFRGLPVNYFYPSFYKYMLSVCVPGSVSGTEDPASWSMISLPSVTS